MNPYWDTDARGVIAGLSSSHRRGDVYRAVLEGIALEQALASDRVAAATGQPIDHYAAIGGGAASDLWCAILANASGRPVRRLATLEASSLGAAVAAAKGAGWYPTIAQAAAAMAGEPAVSFEPEPRDVARYGELRSVYEPLWPALAAWNARRAAFAEGTGA
jgi:xylulokinase